MPPKSAFNHKVCDTPNAECLNTCVSIRSKQTIDLICLFLSEIWFIADDIEIARIIDVIAQLQATGELGEWAQRLAPKQRFEDYIRMMTNTL